MESISSSLYEADGQNPWHYIWLGFTGGISVNQIAQRLNLSRSYFSALFKERIGKPLQEYLTALRMEKAIELMTKHGMTPSVAAVSTGYSDVYNFSRMFKRYTGLSPRAYFQQKNSRH